MKRPTLPDIVYVATVRGGDGEPKGSELCMTAWTDLDHARTDLNKGAENQGFSITWEQCRNPLLGDRGTGLLGTRSDGAQVTVSAMPVDRRTGSDGACY